MDQEAFQALITEIEALGWDKLDHLVAHNNFVAPQEGFVFIGKLLALKTQNIFHVCATLSFVWGFAAPLTMEVLGQNKTYSLFLLKVTTRVSSIKALGMLEAPSYYFNHGLRIWQLMM